MSRFKRYAHSLLSGYALLGANILYTLASVPLALHYLSKAEFGLWSLVTSVAGYVALLDFGLSASASRVLIDHKDRRASGHYGSMVQTGALVGLSQGTLVMLVGSLSALFIGPMLKVDAALQSQFTWLMIGQCILVGIGFYTRIFTHMLTAHQRYDVSNYTQSVLFAMCFSVMWICFKSGLGVMSVLWAQASGTLVVVAVNFYACVRLKFLPERGEWGRPSWSAFHELFAFGWNFFLFALGNQLINASQLLVLTRFYGLEAAAVWSICTRVYLVLSQIIYRLFDYSSAALAEMMVRGEKALLQRRFREIVIFSSSLSVAAAGMLALCNSPFVSVWTSGRINSLQFYPSDIKDPARLAKRLAAPDDPVSQYLWTNFSPKARANIEAVRSSKENTDKLKELFAAELNHTANGEPIYATERFAAAALSKESESLVADKTQGAESLRLNRYLLEDVFPEELANSRKAHWSPVNDVLLGLWLVVCVAVHAHTGLVGQTKVFGFLRFLPFIEGTVFVGLTLLLIRFGSMTMMLSLSIFCTLSFQLPYGLYRTRKYFSISRSAVAGWHRTIPRMLVWLVPVAGGVWWFTRGMTDAGRLGVICPTMGLWTFFVFLRCGLSPSVQVEIFRRSPGWAKPALVRIGCAQEAH
jgi:O-antigen/teichoic acid export membrane protein